MDNKLEGKKLIKIWKNKVGEQHRDITETKTHSYTKQITQQNQRRSINDKVIYISQSNHYSINNKFIANKKITGKRKTNLETLNIQHRSA